MTAPKIVMPSQIVMRATASLIGYARNSRTHDERQIDVLCKSITEYGFTNPILIDGDRGVIAGHGRIMAAEKLELVEVPCIELRHLTNEQKRAYLIADNAIADMSTFNEALLAQELADLSGVGIEATDLGFDAAEVDRLMEIMGTEFAKPLDSWPTLPSGDRAPIQQVTLTLHDDQVATLKRAIEKARGMGPFVDTGNENSNGNAVARICEAFLGEGVDDGDR
jgi:ParB family chromosome partitioning protein